MKTILMLVVVIIASLSSPSVLARQTTIRTGDWFTQDKGMVSFSVIDNDGHKVGALYVTDRHSINSVYFYVNKADLNKIKAAIDATLKEMESTGQ